MAPSILSGFDLRNGAGNHEAQTHLAMEFILKPEVS
jgi:hypothetical protein